MQAANAPLSRLHKNVTAEVVSVNDKLALLWLLGLGGFEVMLGAAGAVPVTFQV